MSIQERLANVKKKHVNMSSRMHGNTTMHAPHSPEHLSALFTEFTASLYVLAIKLKGFHWNIIGDQFFPVHVLLDKQVDSLLGFADSSAELIRQINKAPAPVSMLSMVDDSFIKEVKITKLVRAEQILPVIVTDYTTMIAFCEKVIKCADKSDRQDLSDFAIGVRQYLDKYKWQFDSANK